MHSAWRLWSAFALVSFLCADHATACVCRADESRCRCDCRLSEEFAGRKPQGTGSVWTDREAAGASHDDRSSCRRQLAQSSAIRGVSHMVPDSGRYTVEINGVKRGYSIVGRGPPLILVAPGWGIGSRYLKRGLLPLAVRDDRLRSSLTRTVNSAVAKQDIVVCQMPLGARFVR